MERELVNLHKWNRMILNMVWSLILLIVVAEILGLIYETMMGTPNLQQLFISNIIIPTMWLLAVMIATEIVVRWSSRFADYYIILMATLLPTVLIINFSHISTVHNILFLSILIAAFYYERLKVYLSCLLCMIMFLVLYKYNAVLHARWDGHDLIVSLFIFLTCTTLAIGIMSRGMQILNQLKETMEEQQELLIRNVTMDRMTKIDALTELYNHKTFHEYLDRLIVESKRTGLRLHLAMLDIDNFKKINDSFGHQVGDIVLSTLADGLREWVSPNDFISRYGGEEFAIIFVDQRFEEVLAVAELIRSQVAELNIKEMDGQAVTISIGLQAYEQGTSKEVLFRKADASLYDAKRSGKNKVNYQS